MLKPAGTLPTLLSLATIHITTPDEGSQIIGDVHQNVDDFQDVYVCIGTRAYSLDAGTSISNTAKEILRQKYPNDTPVPEEWIISNISGIMGDQATEYVLERTWTHLRSTYGHITIQMVLP